MSNLPQPIGRTVLKIGLALALAGAGVYYFLIRQWAIGLFEGTGAPAWFESLIHQIYPRLLTEASRFSPAFFLDKADQVILRGIGVYGVLLLSIEILSKKKHWQAQLSAWFEKPYPKTLIAWYARFLYAGILFFTWDWYADFATWHRLAAFYQPHSFYVFFPLPSETGLLSLWAVMIAGSLYCAFRPQFWTGLMASLLFMFLQGFYYNFGKLDHGFATFGFITVLMPFFLWELKNSTSEHVNAWAVRLAKLMIVGTYFLSGIEKLTTSGRHWFDPANLAAHLQLHPTEAGLWLTDYPILLVTGATAVIALQLAFPLILFSNKWRAPILLGGLVFHLGTHFLMHVGALVSPWWWIYCLFFNDVAIFSWNLPKQNGK